MEKARDPVVVKVKVDLEEVEVAVLEALVEMALAVEVPVLV